MLALLLFVSPAAHAATYVVDPSGGGNYTTLTAAISAARSGDTLTLVAGTFTGPFDTGGKNLTIRGAGVANTVLTAGSAATVLTIDNGETVAVSNLAIDGAAQGVEVRTSTLTLTSVHVTDHAGRTPGAGVGLYDGGTLTVDSCVFARNTANTSYDGGGIYASDSTLTISNSTFRDNAGNQGGAIYIDNTVANLTDVTVDGNIASSHGGGIRIRYDASLVADRLTVTNNTSAARGGGLSAYQADIEITDGVFDGNSAGTAGGGLHLDQTSATAATISAEITNNSAGTTGGGLHADTLTLLFDGEISNNAAADDNDGGGIYSINADLTLDGVTLTDNRSGTGGGIFAFYGGTIDIRNATVARNVAVLSGGGVYSDVAVGLTNTDVTANEAGIIGGGLALISADLTLSDVRLADNIAVNGGGGIYVYHGSLWATDGLDIRGGSAEYGGGIAAIGSGREEVSIVAPATIEDNVAQKDGGGLFVSDQASCTLDGIALIGNTGVFAGGGARFSGVADLQVTQATISSNTAELGAGLHYASIGSGSTAYSSIQGNTATASGGAIFAQNPDGAHPFHHLRVLENSAPEGAGIYLFNDVAGDHAIQFSDIVASMGPGVSIRSAPGASIRNTSIAHTQGEAIESDSTSAPTVDIAWNSTFDNTDHYGGALSNLVGTNGNIEGDPDYAGVTVDGNPNNDLLVPGSRSALRDAGDEMLRDLDGSRADIGHLGGPDALDQDYDGDGVPVSAGDCDDANPATHPGASETWYDNEDGDCLGGNDYDVDRDGYDKGPDCDDEDASVHPGAADTSADGVDQDCDGNDGPTGSGGSGGGSGDGATSDDDDLDGDGVPQSEDCDDANASAFPGNIETCDDGFDNDCDSYVDDFDADCVGKSGGGGCMTANGGQNRHWFSVLAVFAFVGSRLRSLRRR